MLKSIAMKTEAGEVDLTPQLNAIITTEVPVGATLKIEAAAGSGKSTALRLYAERHMHREILYLTFTKREAESKQADYEQRGLNHVVVSTLHARAFMATHDLHGGRVVDSLHLGAAQMAQLTNSSSMDWPAVRRASLCRVLDFFLASDASELCATHIDAVASNDRGLLIAAQAVWRAACNPDGGIALTHDMYLKICGVDPGRIARVFGDASLVLLDEAHDCTEAQIALTAAPARSWGLIIVYDFHQRIYGWRRAASAAYICAIPAIAIKQLSCSWRFGPALSQLASTLLSGHSDEVILIEGSMRRNTTICEVSSAPFIKVCGVSSCLAIVARTRRSLFNTAIAGLLSGAVERITIDGDDAYSMFGGRDQLLDTYALYIGRAYHDMLLPGQGAARFTEWGFSRFRAAAELGGWHEAIEACAVVETLGSSLPQLVGRLDAALRSTSPCWLLLLSVHEAKGGEWPYVFVHEDLRRGNHNAEEQLYRLNLAYVAMTRASVVLYLPTTVVTSWFTSLGVEVPINI